MGREADPDWEPKPASGTPASGRDKLYEGPYLGDLSPETKQLIKDKGLWKPPGKRALRLGPTFEKDADTDVRGSIGAEMRLRRDRVEHERMPFLDWAVRVPEPKTGPLDFRRWPFQVELYEAAASDRELVVRKCSQVGISAWLLRWAMYWADMRNLTALYVFPKLKQMYDFSDARIAASIMKSEYLQSRIPPRSVQNKGLKQVGGGFVYFRGSESEDDLESVDADVLALDEYDKLVPENIPVAEARIGASRLGLIRRVGVPTIPGWGVSRLFEDTDMRRWLVKCRCGEEQPLSWGENVDTVRRLRVCRKCGEELRAQEVAAGRWVAERPEVERRGYALNRLVVPHIDVDDLVERSLRTLPEERQSFWNRDMGEPYSPASGRLSLDAIRACQSAGERYGVRLSEGYRGDSMVTMGVDVASVRNLSIRISARMGERRKRALWIGEVESFEELDDLMSAYGVTMACVDHLPEGRSARAFAERWPGRVYLVRYSQGVMQRVIAVDDTARAVTVRRVDAIDACFDAFRGQRNLLPPELPPRYADQLQALQRVVEENESGRKQVRYVSTGRDDYAHAEVYDTVAWEVYLYRRAVEMQSAESFSRLEDHLDFERSVLHETGDVYVEGLGGDYREMRDYGSD